jgi:ABC-2 type transporter
MNLRHGAIPFWTYLATLYLNLIIAEGLVVVTSSVFPIFVVALALTAFINGVWFVFGGFLINPNVLNVFWKYTFYQTNYQRYTYVALVRNQMIGSIHLWKFVSVYVCHEFGEPMYD